MLKRILVYCHFAAGGSKHPDLLWRDNRVKVTIDKKGHFKASVPEDAIGAWYITTGKDGGIVNKRADRPGDVYTQLLILSQK